MLEVLYDAIFNVAGEIHLYVDCDRTAAVLTADGNTLALVEFNIGSWTPDALKVASTVLSFFKKETPAVTE